MNYNIPLLLQYLITVPLCIGLACSLPFPLALLAKNLFFWKQLTTAPEEFRSKAFFKKDIQRQRVTFTDHQLL